MEKSIKERANEYSPLLPGYDKRICNYEFEDLVNAYFDGATEQKELDDKRIAELEKELIFYKGRVEIDDLVETENARKFYMLEAKLKGLIEKACVVFCKRCVHNQTLKKCMYLEKDCPLIGAFRKDLEN